MQQTAIDCAAEQRESLRKNGFLLVKAAIDPALLEKSVAPAWETIEFYGAKYKKAGEDLPYCLPLPIKNHTALLDHAEALLTQLGAEPYWLQNLMLIMKRPGEERRFWHTDRPSIYEPAAEDADELLVLYMLQPTTMENGCILVVPGYAEGPQHSDRVATPIDGEHPVQTELGDVIIMDPRLLHGSLANETADYRFNVRLWIQCRWKERNQSC